MNLTPTPFTGQQISSPQRQLWENPENEFDPSPIYGAADSTSISISKYTARRILVAFDTVPDPLRLTPNIIYPISKRHPIAAF
jgi:hypothetical protein